jgi:hypothetical protein
MVLLTAARNQRSSNPFGDVFPNTGAGSPEQKEQSVQNLGSQMKFHKAHYKLK